jgi:hypothetical protein
MAIHASCLIHGLLLFVAGCSAHRPVAAVAVSDPEVSDAREFVGAVADKMPLWDEDAISRYERVEIATVKADIAVASRKTKEACSWKT